ncbi:HCNGP-like protein-domain-containing protein [Coniella lustricola]|uniref:HCNGP-like protein-domain-containing protein n=1 Tax=Coniella lustricola TaxID=2025994 RepID=A0A2T3A3K9_9PEZI|nr:HCNGP-like protein-domain-containing protein [Coniella lustricola]
MAPLVGYDSSDDDDEVQVIEPMDQQTSGQTDVNAQSAQTERQPGDIASETQPLEVQSPAQPEPAHVETEMLSGPTLPQQVAAIGPSLPPVGAAAEGAYPEAMDDDDDNDDGDQDGAQPDQSAPASPYTANRSAIHNLTLPTVPNLDIPPSPPASPSANSAQAALTAKFDKFLELKRNKGTHFNARIADSHALKNPPLMDKLLGFVGVGTSFESGAAKGTEQYATTLPNDLWDPACFPDWAYRNSLRKAQEKVQKEKAREKGEAVQFVSASS